MIFHALEEDFGGIFWWRSHVQLLTFSDLSRYSYSDWAVMSWASSSMLWNLACSNEHYHHASQGRALLIVSLSFCQNEWLCALLQLPQVVTKTFATVLFAKVFLLQHPSGLVCVCMFVLTHVAWTFPPINVDYKKQNVGVALVKPVC